MTISPPSTDALVSHAVEVLLSGQAASGAFVAAPTYPTYRFAWLRDGTTDYALEGSVFIAGAVVQWLRDGLKLIRSAAESEAQTQGRRAGLTRLMLRTV